MSSFKVRPKRKRKKGTKIVGWAPSDITNYHALLDGRVSDMKRTFQLERQVGNLDCRFEKLEALVKETAAACSKAECRVADSRRLCDETVALMRRRQELIKDDCCKEVRQEISKLVQNSLKKDLRSWKQQRIREQLDAFSDLKSIANIRKNGKKTSLASITKKDGTVETSRQGIAEVFATFYADLYAAHQAVDYVCGDSERHGDLPEVTGQEVERELKKWCGTKPGTKQASLWKCFNMEVLT
jgi:hypothetical protein